MTKRYHSASSFDAGAAVGGGPEDRADEVGGRASAAPGGEPEPLDGGDAAPAALALGEEDLNDHSELRHDLALRSAVGRDVALATRRRCAGWSGGRTGTRRWPSGAVRAVRGGALAPRRLVLDFRDGHGDRRSGLLRPLLYLPVCVLRQAPAGVAPAAERHRRGEWAVLSMLVKALRRWPTRKASPNKRILWRHL